MTDKDRKRERIQITNIRNATSDITIDPADMKKIREYYKLYTHKFDNFNETDHSLKKHKLPQLTQYEIVI